MLSQNQKILTATVAVMAVAAGVFWKVSTTPPPRPTSVAAVTPATLLNAIAEAKQTSEPKPAAAVVVNEPRAEMNFERTGVNTLKLKVTNATKRPFAVDLAAGMVFENEKTEVVLLKSFEAKVAPAGTMAKDLVVAALRSSSQGDRTKFTSSKKSQPKLTPLIQHLESHPTVPVSVMQTAVLAIAEDAPADLFARFPRPQSSSTSAVETFKVETSDIIAALQLLREIGMNSGRLAQDSQLKIEAMIDLKAHDVASQYYGINPDVEWLYWKHELLEGELSTRHYALYGIARFYPDVAMQMMPKWALETRTAPHYRRAAIGALALTQKAGAKPLLQALQRDLAREDQLSGYVAPALSYLEQNLPHAL